MSLFRRKPSSQARSALADPEVACTLPGVQSVHIDYDPAVWLRAPAVGQDRTAWVERSLSAYAEDLGWTPGTEAHGRLDAALNALVDQELPALATFISFTKDAADHDLATVKLLDDELMQLEYGGEQTFLTFDNDPSRPPVEPKTFLDTVQWGARGGLDDQGRYVHIMHAHRRVESEPPLHLAATYIRNRAKADAGPFMSLVYRTRVRLTTGAEA